MPGATKNPTWTSSLYRNAKPSGKICSPGDTPKPGQLQAQPSPQSSSSPFSTSNLPYETAHSTPLSACDPATHLNKPPQTNTTEVPLLDTPITLGEFIIHQQNLINYTNRLVQESQNQQRNEVNNTFIRLVSELETQRQQDLLHIDRGLQILYNTQENRYGHILTQMDSVKKELFFYDNAAEVLIVPAENGPYRTIPTRGKTP